MELPGFLDVNPGLFIWSTFNFVIFILLLAKFAWKPIVGALHSREETIDAAIRKAEEANVEAQKILKENAEKLAEAQQDMARIVQDGREQAERTISAATEEAEKIKTAKIEETKAAIEREKESAMRELRAEVSHLVVVATEKILKEKIDGEYSKKVVDDVIAQIPTRN